MNRRLVRHLPLPIVLMVAGGIVAKYLSETAGAAIVALGTMAAGWLMPQPRSMRKGPPDGP